MRQILWNPWAVLEPDATRPLRVYVNGKRVERVLRCGGFWVSQAVENKAEGGLMVSFHSVMSNLRIGIVQVEPITE
jgi:hypothetical protein